jgi:hypothetical protein
MHLRRGREFKPHEAIVLTAPTETPFMSNHERRLFCFRHPQTGLSNDGIRFAEYRRLPR